MKKHTLLVLLAFGATRSMAQENKEVKQKRMADSIKMVYMRAAALKYPMLRQGAVSVEVLGKGTIRSRLYDDDLFEGKEQITRYRAHFNLPVAEWGKNRVSLYMGFLQQRIALTEVNGTHPEVPVSSKTVDKSTLNAAATYTRMDTVFKRPVIFSATVAGLTDGLGSVERINYMGTVIVPVKRTATTALSLGLVVLIDPSSPTPVVPVISYWHQFRPGLEFFADLPSRIAIRKSLSGKSWLSFGSDLNNNLSFFNMSQPTLPQEAIYSSQELRTGLTFEYLVGKRVVLGINGGMLNTLSSRVFENGKRTSDYFVRNNNLTTPYLNFSISLLPFLSPVIK